MLEDIRKILEVSKRGIVVMEDGKPSYVVVPFTDYIESTTEDRIEDKRSELLNDDVNEKVQNIIENKFEFDVMKEEKTDKIDFLKRDREAYERDSIKKDLKEISLEDLPF